MYNKNIKTAKFRMKYMCDTLTIEIAIRCVYSHIFSYCVVCMMTFLPQYSIVSIPRKSLTQNDLYAIF